MNRIFIIYLFYFTAIFSATAQYWNNRPFLVANDSTINYVIDNKEPVKELTLEARCAIQNAKSPHNGTFGINWEISDHKSILVSVIDRAINNNQFLGIDEVEIKVTLTDESGENKVLEEKIINKNVGTYGNANSLQIKLCQNNNTVISLGNTTLDKQIELDKELSSIPTEATLIIRGKCKVLSMNSICEYDKSISLQTSWTLEELYNKISNKSGIEGVWKYLDRQTDSRYTRLGGNYTIATVEEDDGTVSIIYLSGAQTNRVNWQSCMKKGQLYKTPLIDNYDLKWYDSQMNSINNESYATLEQDGNILTVNFPLLKSSLRFVRQPMEK